MKENYENRLLGSKTQSLSQRNDTQQAQRKYPGLQRNKVTKSVKDQKKSTSIQVVVVVEEDLCMK